MSRVLVIGCGGVAGVAIQKCCQVSEVFTELCIASRTKEKCDALAQKLAGKTQTVITTAQVDADDVDQVIALIREYRPKLVMNIALPYQDLTIMDACLACGVNYMDTANYEPEDTEDPTWRAIYEKRCKEAGFSAYFDYSWQWAYKKKFEEAGGFYNAAATYTGTASSKYATGYTVTADYAGEVTKTTSGTVLYTAVFGLAEEQEAVTAIPQPAAEGGGFDWRWLLVLPAGAGVVGLVFLGRFLLQKYKSKKEWKEYNK